MTTHPKQSKSSFFIKNKLYFGLYTLGLAVAIFLLTQIPKGNENLYFVQFRGSILDATFKFCTHLAEPIAITVLLIILLFDNYRKAIGLLTAELIGLLIASLAKVLFRHNRPIIFFEQLNRGAELVAVQGVDLYRGDTSFPSGHTIGAFVTYTMLALYTKDKKWLPVIFFLLAVSVAVSRMYLGQHFLQDVTLGSFIGILIAIGTYLLLNRIPKLKIAP